MGFKKTLRKALRNKGHKFYLSSEPIDYGVNWEHCTKIKTKKRMKELMDSNKFMWDVKHTSTSWRDNWTVLYLERNWYDSKKIIKKIAESKKLLD